MCKKKSSLSIFFLGLILLLSSCKSIGTETTYNKKMTRGVSVSKPIYLSFNGKNAKTDPTFFFLLEKKQTNHECIYLKVRWYSPYKEKQFKGTESTLAFLINESSILTLHPIKKPRIIGYNIDKGGFEEEAIYTLTNDQLRDIAYAKNVSVELTGKYKIMTARLTKYHSFQAIKNFIENS